MRLALTSFVMNSLVPGSLRVRAYGNAVVEFDGHKDRIAILVDALVVASLFADAFNDVVFLRSLPKIFAGGLPGFRQQLVRGYFQIIGQGLGIQQMDALDD